jgi:hypothetical protein
LAATEGTKRAPTDAELAASSKLAAEANATNANAAATDLSNATDLTNAANGATDATDVTARESLAEAANRPDLASSSTESDVSQAARSGSMRRPTIDSNIAALRREHGNRL